jgi:CubicO group peptidase (beta-lactamase class C family)
MDLSRRAALGLIPAGVGLAACGGGGSANPTQIISDLTAGRAGNRAPAAGFVIMRDGEILASHTSGYASGLSAAEKAVGVKQRYFDIHTPFRAASVSKLATAMIAARLHKSGAIDWDASLHEIMGLVGPGVMDTSFSIPELLSHTSGFIDPDVYWFAHPAQSPLQMTVRYERVRPREFQYCNIGYAWVATALELRTGQRFDHLFSQLFNPLPMDAGFNWSGVSPQKRARGATLYRETREGWQVQADGPDVLSANTPAILIDEGADLSTYTSGQNGTLFSPQGGLRASLTDLAHLAELLADAPELTTPVWTLNKAETNGVHDERYFTQFGTGVHIHPAEESPWPGQTMWGHHGEAYGLYAGAWHLPDLNISVSYAVTGTPETPPARSKRHPALNTFTEPLLRAAKLAYAQSLA